MSVNSRNDMTVQEIDDRIRLIELDRAFPKKWKDIELEYLRAFRKYRKNRGADTKE